VYGDTDVIWALARSMRERAGDLRAEADVLGRGVEAVPWAGLAADAMREAARGRVGRLRRTADAHDSAADALERHAREVDRVKHLIAQVERRVHDLLDSVAGRVAGFLGHLVPDPVAQWARNFVPPPPGSRAWLDVHPPRWA
jgi:hypothetical protein